MDKTKFYESYWKVVEMDNPELIKPLHDIPLPEKDRNPPIDHNLYDDSKRDIVNTFIKGKNYEVENIDSLKRSIADIKKSKTEIFQRYDKNITDIGEREKAKHDYTEGMDVLIKKYMQQINEIRLIRLPKIETQEKRNIKRLDKGEFDEWMEIEKLRMQRNEYPDIDNVSSDFYNLFVSFNGYLCIAEIIY